MPVYFCCNISSYISSQMLLQSPRNSFDICSSSSICTSSLLNASICNVAISTISETGDIELLITYKAPDNTEIVFTSDSLVTFKIKRSSAEIVPPVVDEIRTVNGVLISGIRAMETFGGIIESHADEKDECRRKSWEYLEYHRRAYIQIGKQILAKLDGKDELAGEYWQKAVDYVMQNEDKLQPVLDTLYFRYMTKSRITVTKESEFSGI